MALLVVLLLSSACLITSADESNNGIKNFFGFFNKATTASPTSPPVYESSRTCNCVCGKKNDGSRVVGGETTDEYEYPWMVRLSYFNKFYCGGTLINDRYVLTAAHCVKGFMWFLIKVTFGEHDRCNKTGRPETRFVLRATQGQFSYFNFDNDIAVLRLNDRVPISDTIRPVCLPADPNKHYEGDLATVTGWGTTKENGPTSCLLQKVQLPVMSNTECRQTNYSEKMISDNMLCAGYSEGGKDSCQGDSGGPFVYQRDDKKHEIIGIVSWGNGCARPGNPGVYTRVTRYLDWIKTHTRDGCYCTAEEDGSQTNAASSTTAGPVVIVTEATEPYDSVDFLEKQ